MYKLPFCWNTAMERDGPTMQERDRAAAEAQIPWRRKQENQFFSRVAKHCFETSWTYKALWTSHNLWCQVIPLLLIFLWFLLLYWGKLLEVGLNFQVRHIRGCQFQDFSQHISQSSCLGEGEKGDTGLLHLQVLPRQPYCHPLPPLQSSSSSWAPEALNTFLRCVCLNFSLNTAVFLS